LLKETMGVIDGDRSHLQASTVYESDALPMHCAMRALDRDIEETK